MYGEVEVKFQDFIPSTVVGREWSALPPEKENPVPIG
jgi:hypothetical protein